MNTKQYKIKKAQNNRKTWVGLYTRKTKTKKREIRKPTKKVQKRFVKLFLTSPHRAKNNDR